MKIVVTGANGYIGKHVVKYLLDKGFEVDAIDFSDTFVDKRANYVNFDIFGDYENIYKELKSPDVVIHLAWKDGFIHNSSAHIKYLNAHYKFLNDLVVNGCKNISVMGTMHEIGYYEGAIDENTICNPMSLYGVAKNALRQSLFLMKTNHDFNLFWLRAYYIFGDEARSNSVFAKIKNSANEGKTEFPFNSGKNKYDFIQVEKLAMQIAEASIQSKFTGIINVCSGNPKTLGDMAEEFIMNNNLNIRLNYGTFPDREYDSPAIWGDSTIIDKIINKEGN